MGRHRVSTLLSAPDSPIRVDGTVETIEIPGAEWIGDQVVPALVDEEIVQTFGVSRNRVACDKTEGQKHHRHLIMGSNSEHIATS